MGLGCIFIFQERVRGSVVAGIFNGKVLRSDALLRMTVLFVVSVIEAADY